MTISMRPDVRVTLKLELLQHSGTFKARGALHFMLTNRIAEAGVAAASGGNHGAAVAWAAARLGHRATIFVPTVSAPAKVDRLRQLGAEVIQIGQVYAEALAACEKHVEATGATGVHAYEDPAVMAGAGTTGLEFEAQVAAQGLPRLDHILVACGGGGLAGGIATWTGPRGPRVVACETTTTSAWAAARRAGHPVDVPVSGIAVDALGATSVGNLAFAALTDARADSAVVSDHAVIAARHRLWSQFRVVAEPAAVVPLAALWSGTWKPAGESHIGVVVCGANTDPTDLGQSSPVTVA